MSTNNYVIISGLEFFKLKRRVCCI